MINNTLFLRINNLPHLTKREANIVSYFNEVRTELALESVQSISEGAGVSKATVTRFVKKLGYEDFNEFKAYLRRELSNTLDSPYQRYQNQMAVLAEGDQDPWTLAVEAAMGDLKEALALNSSEKIAQTAQVMSQNKGNLYIMGQMVSYGMAHYFHQSLHFLKRSILLDSQAGSLAMQLVDVNETDVLFAISYLNYSHQTILAMKHFHQQGAKVVLLTDSETSPPAQWSDIQLIAPTQWETLLLSRCSCMMVIDGLLSAMTYTTEDRNLKRINHIKRLTDEFQVFQVQLDTSLQKPAETKRKGPEKKP